MSPIYQYFSSPKTEHVGHVQGNCTGNFANKGERIIHVSGELSSGRLAYRFSKKVFLSSTLGFCLPCINNINIVMMEVDRNLGRPLFKGCTIMKIKKMFPTLMV